jgi:uncharacterized protein DUF6788
MIVDVLEETLRAGQRRGPAAKNGHLLPKTGPRRGSLHAELKRCGKPNCRCTHGVLHGPYWSLRWREGNRQRRRYVRPDDLERVQTGLDLWRRQHPPARAMRERLSALRRLLRELDGGW